MRRNTRSPGASIAAEPPGDVGRFASGRRTRVRTREELGESLARFALTNSALDPHVILARFRRRELLRTYLHDIRGIRTIVETTEELSNLADAILEYALNLSRQLLDNRYGSPQNRDDRGRITSPDFCIVALGKLGSRELNYASDVSIALTTYLHYQGNGAVIRVPGFKR